MRIALGVEYDGSGFCGWQSQPGGGAVQDCVERALTEIAGEPISVICAGRTDAGVHALGQVIHFDTDAVRPESGWIRGVNSRLPAAVAVTWRRVVDATFHARYSALARRYRYFLLNHPVRPACGHGRLGWFHRPLNVAAMRAGAQLLVGEHDFSAFRSSECQARSPVRRIHAVEIEREGDLLVFDVRGNAFLHHMVRNIVGCLVDVGKGGHAPEWIAAVLESRQRSLAAPTFSAAGLYLTQIEYDDSWNLPAAPRGGTLPVHAANNRR